MIPQGLRGLAVLLEDAQEIFNRPGDVLVSPWPFKRPLKLKESLTQAVTGY